MLNKEWKVMCEVSLYEGDFHVFFAKIWVALMARSH